MADIKLLLVEDDENLAYMEKSSFEDIIGGYEVKTAITERTDWSCGSTSSPMSSYPTSTCPSWMA